MELISVVTNDLKEEMTGAEVIGEMIEEAVAAAVSKEGEDNFDIFKLDVCYNRKEVSIEKLRKVEFAG